MNGSMPLITLFAAWCEWAFDQVLRAGITAGLLAVVVLAINVLFRRWISARQMSWLWGLVLLRLLMPVAPSSALSLQNVLTGERATENAASDLSPPSDGDAWTRKESLAAAAFKAESSPAVLPPNEPNLNATTVAARLTINLNAVLDRIVGAIPLIWFAGAAACVLGTVVFHWRFCRLLRHAAPLDDPGLSGPWQACREQVGLGREIPILRCHGLSQPAVLGLFRPKLLWPAVAPELSDEQLRLVMLHELAHIARWHVATNWLLVAVRAIHWWNPVYWLAAARFQNLREQACDAFAIEQTSGRPTRAYSELLLTLAQQRPRADRWRVVLPASILGFLSAYFRKRQVANRLRALRTAGIARGRWHVAGVAALTGLVAVGGLTDARLPAAPPPVRASQWLSQWLPPAAKDWTSYAAPPSAPGPVVTRVYDIAPALARLESDGETRDDPQWQLRCHLNCLLSAMDSGQDAASASDRPRAEEAFSIDDTRLTVTAPTNVQDELASNLRAWEQSGLAQTSIETRFITADRDITQRLGISWRYLEAFSDDREQDFPSEKGTGDPVVRAKASIDDYLPMALATLDEQQAQLLVRAAQGEPRANVFAAPRITLFNGQRASILDRAQRPFVVGIEDDRAGLTRPKIAIIDEGIKLTLRAIQSVDHRRIELAGRLELSEISEVITASTQLDGETKTIQVPRVKRCRIDVASEIPDGKTLLIGCIPAYEQQKFFYVLLTARCVNVTAPVD
jgi:bla regulator protein BlaR1